MKPIKVLLSAALIILFTGAYSQRTSRADVCQNIPNLTNEQKHKIDKLSLAHIKTMDALRTQFYAENDAVKASNIKAQMNTERANHYREISGLLTPEQQTWFNQKCFVNGRRGYYGRGGFGRNGQGYGYGRGYGRGWGYGRGQCRGRGMGRGMGRITY